MMNFAVLLTVHLSIFISVINQLYAQNFCFTISLFHASTCFEHMCSKHLDITHLIYFDVLLTVHLSIFISVINQLDAQNFCFTISLFHASTCFENMCSASGSQNCITPNAWDKLIVKQKFCPSSWLITVINKSVMTVEHKVTMGWRMRKRFWWTCSKSKF